MGEGESRGLPEPGRWRLRVYRKERQRQVRAHSVCGGACGRLDWGASDRFERGLGGEAYARGEQVAQRMVLLVDEKSGCVGDLGVLLEPHLLLALLQVKRLVRVRCIHRGVAVVLSVPLALRRHQWWWLRRRQALEQAPPAESRQEKRWEVAIVRERGCHRQVRLNHNRPSIERDEYGNYQMALAVCGTWSCGCIGRRGVAVPLWKVAAMDLQLQLRPTWPWCKSAQPHDQPVTAIANLQLTILIN